MWRYCRLYAYFLRFSFSRAMEFRLDFFFQISMDLLFYVANIAFYKLIFLHTGLLAGWGEPEMMVFVAGYLVIDAMNMAVFSANLWWLPQYVNRGDVDYYLVRPVSSLFFLSLRNFAASSFVNLLMALGILAWMLSGYPHPLDASRLALFGFLLLNGVLLYYLVHILLIIPVFWTHSGRGLDQIFWNLSRSLEKPDRIFSGWVRKILTTVLPFSLMASFPARFLFEEFDPSLFAHLVCVSIGFAAAVLVAWKAALRAYSSASS